MNRIIVGAAVVAAFASAPLALSRREVSAKVPAPEIISMPESVAAPTASRTEVRSAWTAFAALRITGMALPSEPRFIEAFFDGRLPEAADYVRKELATLDAQGAVRIADRARSFDRALVQLSPAPAALLRVFVERAEDPGAHEEATRANAGEIAGLIGDAALGERAFVLLRASECVPAGALKSLAARIGRDPWARSALGSMGHAAIPVLVEALESPDALRRAAAAWVLAGLETPAHADRILQAALPELARDSVPGNAAFAIRALSALGERARPAVRGLLKSGDDQAVAAALQVLMRTGGASADDLEAARARVERLAARAGEAGDEASIGLELRAALGVAQGAMKVPDPPETLNPSQTGSSGRIW